MSNVNYSTLPEDADACVTYTIRDCLSGNKIHTAKDTSNEQLHYQTGLLNPRARIMTNPYRPLNIVVALARFVWMISANNRVEDIAFYEPKVRGFSDDGLTVPGSDYGLRLFQPRPGLNQIQGVINRLNENPLSRQAAAVVWQPEDAARADGSLGDIPCTHGLFFHVRDLSLTMAVTMRSNNAFRILPFNIFEFTMLQELVATEISRSMGPYKVWAASMHTYENERETEPTSEIGRCDPATSIIMPPMPPNSMEQAFIVARLEASARHAGTANELSSIWREAEDTLDSYWLELLGVLFTYIAAKRNWYWAWSSAVPSYLLEPVQQAIQKMFQGVSVNG